MPLPKIDISSLPDLETVTGLFGSTAANAIPVMDDGVVAVMVLLYELSSK